MQMCEEEFFPSEGMNKFVKNYLEEGGNPYLLGIAPKDLGWVATIANALEDIQEVQEEWSEEQGKLVQGAFSIGSWVGEQAASMAIEKVAINPFLRILGKENDMLKSLLTSGAQWYNAGYEKGMQGGYGYEQGNMIGMLYTLGAWVVSNEKVSSDATYAVFSMTVEGLSKTELGKWCTNVAKKYSELPEEVKGRISTVKQNVKSVADTYIEDEKGKIAGKLAGKGAETIMGPPAPNERMRPSDELIEMTEWMMYY